MSSEPAVSSSPRWSRRAGVAIAASLLAVLVLPSAAAPAAQVTSGVVDVGVVASGDDAEELANGYLDVASSDLELAVEQSAQTVGIRLRGVAIPRGAKIDSAWIQFTVDESSTGSASLFIRAENSANPVAFSGTRGISSRPVTASVVGWVPASWPTVGAAGADQRTPDLSLLVQAVVDRGDWVSGNAVVFIITGTGTRTAESFNGSAAPRLRVAWHIETTPTTTTTTTTTTVPTTTTTTVPTTTTTTTVPTAATTRLAVIGDYGGAPLRQQAVADMIDAWGPDAVVTVGDNVYWDGGYDQIVAQFYHQYIGSYTGIYGVGSIINRFFPALGNHDYTDGGLSNYLSFFDLPGIGVLSSLTSGNERYYDVRFPEIHLFVVNSNPEEANGVTPTSVQGVWLRTAMAASDAEWKVVTFHHAPFSSIPGKTTLWMQWPFAEWGADLVLSGHAHVYERLRIGGFDYAISGLGINNTVLTGPRMAGSEAFYSADDAGALFIVACASAMQLEYRGLVGGVVDTYTLGSGSCG